MYGKPCIQQGDGDRSGWLTRVDRKEIKMKKHYKIQLPKGKKVTMTNVNFEDGVMTVNVELENRTNFHEAMHNEVCGVFGKINNEFKEVLKANGVTREKIEEMAKEPINEHDKQIDKILKMEDDKDVRTVANMILQEYGENIRWKKQQKCMKEQKYEPKDGDFILLKWKGIKTLDPYEKEEREAIAIFKEFKNDMLFCYITYLIGEDFKNHPVFIPLFDNNGHKLSNGYTSTFDEIRPATEKEKKLMIDKLAVINKRWNEEKKCLEDVRWRAKKGELYRWVSADGYVKESTDEHGECNNCYYKSGNYFKTEEAAEKVAEQIRGIFKNSKAE